MSVSVRFQSYNNSWMSFFYTQCLFLSGSRVTTIHGWVSFIHIVCFCQVPELQQLMDEFLLYTMSVSVRFQSYNNSQMSFFYTQCLFLSGSRVITTHGWVSFIHNVCFCQVPELQQFMDEFLLYTLSVSVRFQSYNNSWMSFFYTQCLFLSGSRVTTTHRWVSFIHNVCFCQVPELQLMDEFLLYTMSVSVRFQSYNNSWMSLVSGRHRISLTRWSWCTGPPEATRTVPSFSYITTQSPNYQPVVTPEVTPVVTMASRSICRHSQMTTAV